MDSPKSSTKKNITWRGSTLFSLLWFSAGIGERCLTNDLNMIYNPWIFLNSRNESPDVIRLLTRCILSGYTHIFIYILYIYMYVCVCVVCVCVFDVQFCEATPLSWNGFECGQMWCNNNIMLHRCTTIRWFVKKVFYVSSHGDVKTISSHWLKPFSCNLALEVEIDDRL